MNPKIIAQRKIAWVAGEGAFSDIIIYCGARLCRNVAFFPFPAKCSEIALTDLYAMLSSLTKRIPMMSGCYKYLPEEMDDISKSVLAEARIVPEFFHKKGKALFVDKTGLLSVVINCEDHVVMQAITGGLSFREAIDAVEEADDVLKDVGYAKDDEFGYLTASPFNVGTGFRAFALIYLPGLSLANQMEVVTKDTLSQGVIIKPAYWESDTGGSALYELYSGASRGESVEEQMMRIEKLTLWLGSEDWNAVSIIEKNHKLLVEDKSARALGVLSNAKVLGFVEALKELSWLRLAARIGVLPAPSAKWWNETVLNMGSARIQAELEILMTPEEAAQERAKRVKQAVVEFYRA